MLESSKVGQRAKSGIKSKGRVKEFGEVFTPDKTVNDMLDLTDSCFTELSLEEYISKTYLEPACGDGQFLIRILYRKLERIANSSLEDADKEKLVIKSLCTIYGVDIQQDNVKEARNRMYNLVLGNRVRTFNLGGVIKDIQVDVGVRVNEGIINKILEHNIIVGNTLVAFEHYKKPTDGEEVRLIEYRFDGDKVKAWRNTLHTNFISDETDWFNVFDINKIYDIMDNKANDCDEVEDFDSF